MILKGQSFKSLARFLLTTQQELDWSMMSKVQGGTAGKISLVQVGNG